MEIRKILNGMKTLATLSLVSIFTSSMALAGGFGGPGPFRNGSPLPTGTDGKYQAVATANNVTGIFGFEISGGLQTSRANSNNWVFFVDGEVVRGSTTANISEGKVTGVFDSQGSTGIPTSDNGQAELPVVIIIPGNSATGSFSGTMDMNSPVAAFKGSGSIQGVPDRVDQIVGISQPQASTTGGGTVTGAITVTGPILVNIPGSSLEAFDFKFRGTRLNPFVQSNVTDTTP